MTSRRRFIELVPAAGAALCWGTPALAQAARLDESDPKAVAVGYVHDASRVDARKYPKYLPGEDCAGCLFYLAKPTEPWGPCSIFPRKLVAARGWCDAFATRPRQR